MTAGRTRVSAALGVNMAMMLETGIVRVVVSSVEWNAVLGVYVGRGKLERDRLF